MGGDAAPALRVNVVYVTSTGGRETARIGLPARASVAQLKRRIAEAFPELRSDWQRLVYKGRELGGAAGTSLPLHGGDTVYVVRRQAATVSPPWASSSDAARRPRSSAEADRVAKRSKFLDAMERDATAYRAALQRQGLDLRKCSGDGNCLFRAVAHQVYGSEEHHVAVRHWCCEYMAAERDFFAPHCVGAHGEESSSSGGGRSSSSSRSGAASISASSSFAGFEGYLRAKRCDGCWGDDPEVSAMGELYRRPVEIWVFDATRGASLLRRVGGAEPSGSLAASVVPIRLSFYRGGHYDSIVTLDSSHEVAMLPATTTTTTTTSTIGPATDGASLASVGTHEAGVVELSRSRAPGQLEAALAASRTVALDASSVEAALDALQREVMRESTVCAEQHEREMMERALALSRDESESASTRAAAAIEERELGDAMARSLLAVTEGEQMLAVVVNSQLPTLTAMFTSYPVGLLRHALERTQRVGVGGVPSVDADLAVSWLFESGAEYLQTHLELYRG